MTGCPVIGIFFRESNDGHGHDEDDDHGHHDSLLGHLLIPESGFLIIIGIIIGVIIKVTKLDHELENEIMKFNHEVFFLIFTPPILIKMTYFSDKSTLLHNIGLISYYALVGTLYFTFFLGGLVFYSSAMEYSFVECLVLSGLLACIDPVPVLECFHEEKVNHRIHELIESEAIFKHATSIILYSLFLNFQLNITNENLHLVGSIFGLGIVRFLVVIGLGALLGFFVGFLGSLFTRFTFKKHMNHYQSLIIYLTCYLGYFVTETFVGIGILGLVTSTLFMSRYVKYNLSWKSRNTINQNLKMASSIAESLLFLYLGISIIDFEHEFNWMLIVVCNAGCIAVRFLFVYITNTSWNIFFMLSGKKCEIIPRSDTFVMAFSGVRGALSFALAFVLPDDFENRSVFVTTALSVIVFTVFVQGSMIGPVIHLLGIEKAHLKIKDKVTEYKKIEKYLRKVLYLIPHPRTKEGVRSILVKDCNRNYKKTLNKTQTFLARIKRDEKLVIHEKVREKLSQRKKELKNNKNKKKNKKKKKKKKKKKGDDDDDDDDDDKPRSYEEEVKMMEKEEKEELEHHPDIELLSELKEFLMNDANGFYSDDSMIHPKELSDGFKMRIEVHDYVRKLRRRIAELLRYCQYKDSVVKIPRDELELALGFHAVGEIPPEWVSNKIHEEKSILMKMVKGFGHFIVTIFLFMDRFIQIVVNRRGFKKEVKFSRATVNFKSYCLCNYTNEYHHGDEDEIFLETDENDDFELIISSIPQKKKSTKDGEEEEEEEEIDLGVKDVGEGSFDLEEEEEEEGVEVVEKLENVIDGFELRQGLDVMKMGFEDDIDDFDGDIDDDPDAGYDD